MGKSEFCSDIFPTRIQVVQHLLKATVAVVDENYILQVSNRRSHMTRWFGKNALAPYRGQEDSRERLAEDSACFSEMILSEQVFHRTF